MITTNEKANHGLSAYEIEQPIASFLGDYANDLAKSKRNGIGIEREKTINHMSINALAEIEHWSRAIGFLIWKASTSDDACTETVYSMGVAAETLRCLASLVQPLGELENIQNIKKIK